MRARGDLQLGRRRIPELVEADAGFERERL
jgi:hypothetical protein